MGDLMTRLEAVAERIASLLLALQLVLGIPQLLDAFRVWYYPTIHRATRLMRFELGTSLVAPLMLLLVLWLCRVVWRRRVKLLLFPALAFSIYPFLGFEAALSAASLMAAAGGLLIQRRLDGFLSWVFLLLSGFEAAALLYWVVFVPLGLTGPFESVAGLELDLFYIFAYLAPLLVLPLMFMWGLKQLLRWGWGEAANVEDVELKSGGGLSIKSVLFLALSASLGVAAALYPYSSAVNPRSLNVGVDIPHYVKAAEVIERDVFQAFNVSGGSRPLIYLVIYGVQRLFGLEASTAVRFLPVLLNPLLVLAAFFLAFEVFGDGWAAGWAAFFTACGFQVSVGMYSYFLTNLLGLCLVFFSLGLLFRSLRCGCRASLAAASLLGGLLVFTHPWTFDQYYTAAVLTAGIIWFEARVKEGGLGKFWAMSVYLVSLGAAELLKVLVFHGVGGVSASSTAVKGFAGLSKFWFSSIFSFRLLYGGLMSSLVLIGLAVLGVYVLRCRDVPEVYFTVFTALTSLVFLIGDETIKSRLLYNVPVGLFAALGFKMLLGRRLGDDVKRSLVLFVALNLVVYLFRSMANLV